jgi:hypothetical protein
MHSTRNGLFATLHTQAPGLALSGATGYSVKVEDRYRITKTSAMQSTSSREQHPFCVARLHFPFTSSICMYFSSPPTSSLGPLSLIFRSTTIPHLFYPQEGGGGGVPFSRSLHGVPHSIMGIRAGM